MLLLKNSHKVVSKHNIFIISIKSIFKINIVDFLTKQNKNPFFYRGFDKIDIMAIVSLEKFHIKNKEELRKNKVSYGECIEFIKVSIFFIF